MGDAPNAVAIIGAGAAGLAAAQRLSVAGKRVVILEARDRIGGRIHSLRDPQFPLPVELGAEFIHGRDSETFQILRAMNAAAYLADGDHFHFKNGTLGQCNDFWDQLDKVLGKLDELGRNDMSFAQFVEQHCAGPALAEARELAMSFVEGFDAARADRISAKSLAKAEEASGDGPEGSESFRLLGGYGSVIEHLLAGCAAEKLTLQLRTHVRRIEWKRGDVRIVCETPDGSPRETVRAKAALITLPVGVLKERTVVFDPDLPDKFDAAAQIEMGPVVKVVLNFRTTFWEERPIGTADGKKLSSLAFMHSRDETAVPTWWTYHPIRATVLTGWAGGPAADWLARRPAAAIVAEALGSLAQFTGIARGELDQMLQAWHVADWQADPLARGAYSYVTVGNISAPKRLAAPVQQTLFFAGEATDTQGIGGTVDAALSSGRRAAGEILG